MSTTHRHASTSMPRKRRAPCSLAVSIVAPSAGLWSALRATDRARRKPTAHQGPPRPSAPCSVVRTHRRAQTRPRTWPDRGPVRMQSQRASVIRRSKPPPSQEPAVPRTCEQPGRTSRGGGWCAARAPAAFRTCSWHPRVSLNRRLPMLAGVTARARSALPNELLFELRALKSAT